MIASPEAALDTLAREELGVDPETLGGSAWEAAFASFLLFCLGAVVPVFPFFFTSGAGAVIASLAVSALALFVVGAGITLVTGKRAWRSGLRQTLFGMVAAGVTFGIGTLLGAAITGCPSTAHAVEPPRPTRHLPPPAARSYRAPVTAAPPRPPRLATAGSASPCSAWACR